MQKSVDLILMRTAGNTPTVSQLALAFLGLSLMTGLGADKWPGERKANLVLGQAGFTTNGSNQGGTTAADGFESPKDVVVDPATGKVFVSDSSNNRVLLFASLEILANGAAAEGVLGQKNFTDNGFSAYAENSLHGPTGLALDPNGNLWVADVSNRRVLVFENSVQKALDAITNEVSASADGVLGQDGWVGSSAAVAQNRFLGARKVTTDLSGRVWVSDGDANRVLRFDNALSRAKEVVTTGTAVLADVVLGQTDFVSFTSAAGADGLASPGGLFIDAAGTMWLADTSNGRVVRYNNVSFKGNGSSANGMLGRDDWATGMGTTEPQDATVLRGPEDVVVDPDGVLWVSDTILHRVLGFSNPVAKSDEFKTTMQAAAADCVLGQPDFTTILPRTVQAGVNSPGGLGVAGDGSVLVAEFSNYRVTRFSPGQYQPDGWIGTSPAVQRGDDIFNTTGGGQLVSRVAKRGRKSRFFGTFESEAPDDDELGLTGTRKNRFFKVTYLETTAGRVNVTATVTTGSYSESVPYTEKKTFETQVKPSRKAKGRTKRRTWSQTGNSGESGEKDVVKEKVKSKWK